MSTSIFREQQHIDVNQLKHDEHIEYHMIPLDMLVRRFHTNPTDGLTDEQAHRHYAIYGPNMLSKAKQDAEWKVFLRCFFSGFASLLWCACALCFIAFGIEHSLHGHIKNFDHVSLGIILLTCILITGILSYYHVKQSSKIMESFQKLMPQYATVIREGMQMIIAVESVVLGDLVEVKAGDRVPADLRITECHELKVDNSSLTGESEPVTLSTEYVHENSVDAKNLAFFSCMVVNGRGRGLVIAVGDNSQIGRIAGLTTGLTSVETPLSKELRRFVIIITIVSLTLGALFFIIVMSLGYNWLDAMLYLIAIVVANVPEGLLVTLTMCLRICAKRMAKKNCLVKHLLCVETLGSTSVICSDKTGTLTQNMMSVSHVWVDGKLMATHAGEDNPTEDIDIAETSFQRMLQVMMLCNRAEFAGGQEDLPPRQRKVIGDASESALLKFAEAAVGNVKRYRSRHRKMCEIPFSSDNKYQVSIHEASEEGSQFVLVMKGAPERLIDRCSSILRGGRKEKLTRAHRTEISNMCQNMAEKGERVLAFCNMLLPEADYPKGYKFVTNEPNFPLTGLVFVGLASMMDPPRPGVREAVANCRSAGIRIIMVTGDHPTTAKSIAREVGIISENSETAEEVAQRRGIPVSAVDPKEVRAIVVHGTELVDMPDYELDEILHHYPEIVFARTTPTQKLNIVEGVQRQGAIVAVTGDGVNDSPALKKADIGIAMGLAGSDVAKQAADMILLDDNFASIVTGVEEGRVIFDNLKKTIAYTLTSNTPEMSPFIFSIIANIPLPLGIMAIIAINVGTDMWPAMSLAYEPAESDIMNRQPRDPQADKLVNWRLISMSYLQIGGIQAVSGFFVYFALMAEHGWMPNRLFGLRKDWENTNINDLTDSYGQEWTFEQRDSLQKMCFAAFFIAIVEVQVADVIICKTRRISIVTQGMNNHCLNAGIAFTLFLGIIFVYVPYVNTFLRMEAASAYAWILPLPFAAFIIFFDECRRYWIRHNYNSFIELETYY